MPKMGISKIPCKRPLLLYPNIDICIHASAAATSKRTACKNISVSKNIKLSYHIPNRHNNDLRVVKVIIDNQTASLQAHRKLRISKLKQFNVVNEKSNTKIF